MKKPRRIPVLREERVEPTPETVAKLTPDPVQSLYDRGLIQSEHTAAALEIRAIYFAVVGSLFARANDPSRIGFSKAQMSDRLAVIHRDRYKPWCAAMGQKLPFIMDALVDLSWCHEAWLIAALEDYAQRMSPVRHTIAIDRHAQLGY